MTKALSSLICLAAVATFAAPAFAGQTWDPYNPGKDARAVAGIAGGTTLGEAVRIRIAGDISDKQAHVLAAAGVKVENGYALVGVSSAREAILGYDEQTLDANGVVAEAAWSSPAARILKAYVTGRFDKASSRHLGRTVVQDTAVTVEDLVNTVRTITTLTTTTTDSTFRGGTRGKVSAGLDLALRDSTVGHVQVSHQRLAVPSLSPNRSTQVSVGLTEYFPEHGANVTLAVANKGRVALAGQKTLSDHWLLNVSAYADTRGDLKQRGVYAGLGYQWGATQANPGVAPATAEQQLDARLARMTTHSDSVRGVQGLGRVERVVSQTVQVTTVDQPKASAKPATPSKPPPEQPPADLGSVSGSMPPVELIIGETAWDAVDATNRVFVTNTSTVPVTLGVFVVINPLHPATAGPVGQLGTDTCSGATLQPGESCIFAEVGNHSGVSLANGAAVDGLATGVQFTVNGVPTTLSSVYSVVWPAPTPEPTPEPVPEPAPVPDQP